MAQRKSMRKNQPSQVPVSIGKGPFVFVLEGRICRGEIQLTNRTDEWQLVPALGMSGFGILDHDGNEQQSIELNANLPPRQTQPIKIFFNIYATMPIGKHQGQITLGDQAETVSIFVAENRVIEISPDSLTIFGRPGETAQASILVKNMGNADCQLPSTLYLALADSSNYEMSAVTALQSTGKDGYDAVRDHFIQAIAELQADAITVQLKSSGTIGPGQFEIVDLEFPLSNDLRPNRNYQGTVTIYNEKIRCSIQVVKETIKTK